MIDRKFITIGYRKDRRTALNELREIGGKLKEGRNAWLRYKTEPGKSAYSWVSIEGTDFEVYPLDYAVAKGLVVHCPDAKWIADNKTYQGDAYFPNGWIPPKDMTGIPSSVAVKASNFSWGRVETKGRNPDQPKECVGFFVLSSLKPASVNVASDLNVKVAPALKTPSLDEPDGAIFRF